MTSFDEFESRLQSILEVHLLKHLPGYKVEDGIAQELAAAMHAHLKEENGTVQAPNIYVIFGNPSTNAHWQGKPRLLKELATALYVAGKEAGFKFSTKPTVITKEDSSLSVDEMRIVASFHLENAGETVGRDSGEGAGAELPPEEIPNNAFLILNGSQIVPLKQSVINIGRRLDNHIVIDDPRVSRTHAQLRTVNERYVLFDLNSSGGTYVNGGRIEQSVLYPGDVISLAGVSLIFGQDLPAGRISQEGQTKPSSTISNNRTSARIERNKDNY